MSVKCSSQAGLWVPLFTPVLNLLPSRTHSLQAGLKRAEKRAGGGGAASGHVGGHLGALACTVSQDM